MEKELEDFRVSSLRELQEADNVSYETYLIDGFMNGYQN